MKNIKNSREKQQELQKTLILKMAKTSISGIDAEEFGRFLVQCYDEKLNPKKIEKLTQEKYNVDKETAHWMVYVVMKKAVCCSNWLIAKERGANCFSLDSPFNDRYDGVVFPIGDFMDVLPFIVENYASPTFHKK
jgi:hypothetical protein